MREICFVLFTISVSEFDSSCSLNWAEIHTQHFAWLSCVSAVNNHNNDIFISSSFFCITIQANIGFMWNKIACSCIGDMQHYRSSVSFLPHSLFFSLYLLNWMKNAVNNKLAVYKFIYIGVTSLVKLTMSHALIVVSLSFFLPKNMIHRCRSERRTWSEVWHTTRTQLQSVLAVAVCVVYYIFSSSFSFLSFIFFAFVCAFQVLYRYMR